MHAVPEGVHYVRIIVTPCEFSVFHLELAYKKEAQRQLLHTAPDAWSKAKVPVVKVGQIGEHIAWLSL